MNISRKCFGHSHWGLSQNHQEMKKSWLLVFLTSAVLSANAQPKPQMLTAPASWEFEQFSLPPGFAPTVKYHGLEELRFSPGWAKKDATDFFTVIWALRFDDTKSVSPEDIKDYLLTYFRGLCDKTAKDRKMSPIDTTAITVAIGRKPTPGNSRIFDVSLHLFGVFTDGAPVTLNMEVKELEDLASQKVYLLMVASPQPRTDPVWRELYKVQREFVIPDASRH